MTRPSRRPGRILAACLPFLPSLLCFLYHPVSRRMAAAATAGTWIWPLAGALFALWGAAALLLALLDKRPPKWFLVLFRSLLAAGLALFLTAEVLILSHMKDSPREEPDYLVILGALVDGRTASPALQSRIDAAADYLLAHPSVKAVCCGAAGPDEDISEARCIADGLTAAGIAPERLLLEERSSTTSENLSFAAKLLPGDASVCVVTSNFHLFRAMMSARSAGFGEVSGLAAPFGGALLPHYLVREFMTLTADTLSGRLRLFSLSGGIAFFLRLLYNDAILDQSRIHSL